MGRSAAAAQKRIPELVAVYLGVRAFSAEKPQFFCCRVAVAAWIEYASDSGFYEVRRSAGVLVGVGHSTLPV